MKTKLVKFGSLKVGEYFTYGRYRFRKAQMLHRATDVCETNAIHIATQDRGLFDDDTLVRPIKAGQKGA